MLARPTRFELVTYRVETDCSIQLSYGRIDIYYYKVFTYILATLILTAQALYSGVSVIKSTASEVKSLVLVVSGKAKLIKIAPGGDFSVNLALAKTAPLLDSTFKRSKSTIESL